MRFLLIGMIALLTGCSGFQMGSFAYCAKEDNCSFQALKQPKPANATAPAQPARPAL